MPCNIPTVQSAACDSGVGKVSSEIKMLQIIAQSEAAIVSSSTGAAITPAAISARACASGIAKESNPIRLLQIIAQLLNDSGGGTATVSSLGAAACVSGIGKSETLIDLISLVAQLFSTRLAPSVIGSFVIMESSGYILTELGFKILTE